MKSKNVSAVLLIALFFTVFVFLLNGTNFTYAASKERCTISSVDQNSIVYTRSEQTVWKYRVVDDKVQKRLWSKTYNKWLTDWEWV